MTRRATSNKLTGLCYGHGRLRSLAAYRRSVSWRESELEPDAAH